MKNALEHLYSLPLDELPIVVIDLETTGLRPQIDAICEIGAIQLQGEHLLEEYATLINPQRPISEEVTQIHQLTLEGLKDAPLLQDVLPTFLQFIGSSAIAGHNVGFDLSFLYPPIRTWGIDLYQRPILDTLQLARALYPKLQRYGLTSLAETFELPQATFHHALEDTRTTAFLLQKILKKAKEEGIRTLAQLEQKYPSPRPPKPFATMSKLEQQLWTAIQHGLDLDIRYRGRDGEAKQRRISPTRFFPPYVQAYCHLREQPRSFRIDRIERHVLKRSEEGDAT